eukprot:Seg800.10 transcript_id=Seg800.10/GoldUCD/mRNA.D3Y31 product="CWF19-like protein 2" protein_id=Seg800.10/GoldUCD/D3Y31
MAQKYEGSFVSKKVIDKDRESRKSYLDGKLEQARSDFEAKKRLKELKEQRGETTWMLPSLSSRLKEDKEETRKHKKKKKHEKKPKKHKKEKKHKKKKLKVEHENSDESRESDGSSGDEWVEMGQNKSDTIVHSAHLDCNESMLTSTTKHDSNTTKPDQNAASVSTKREDWMLSSSFLDVMTNASESIAEKQARKLEEKREFKKPSIDEMGQHRNELNPHWKDGGSGLPPTKDQSEAESSKERQVGDSGRSWIQKAYERAKEQAGEQGRSLEDVVSERFGSMEKLNALLKAGDRRKRNVDEKTERRGWRKQEKKDDYGRKEREHKGWISRDREEKSRTYATPEKNLSNHYPEARTRITESPEGRRQPEKLEDTSKPNERRKHATTLGARPSTSKTEESSGSDTDASDSSMDSDDNSDQPDTAAEPLTEKEINEISAKILRAELMGNEELVTQLQAKLDAGRKSKEQTTSKRSSGAVRKVNEEEEVILTRTDKHGNIYPLKVSGEESAPRKKRRKVKKIETHDAKGNRVRYFQEDDSTDLKSMVYLALPITSSLTDGHCLIVPMQHILACTYLDEDIMQEVKMFKTALVKMFNEKDQDVIFLETVKNLKKQYHMFIECIPVPKEVGDLAPIYFKKAIQESESEWAQNKKVVEVTKSRGIKFAIPKGLPYFAVEFGLDGGFAHVIEDEASFQHYFGKEIIGGIMDLEPVKWRKPPKESFQQHKRKVLDFSEIWEPCDWTRDM